jgi:purine-binding chemotaxis protein CheW
MTNLRVATFWAEDLQMAVKVERVQEVLRSQKITPVPRAHPCVQGLLNLRGQIVTAIDARRRLGLPERDPSETVTHLIIPSGGDPMSLVVDREGDIVDLESDPFDVPETVDSGVRSLVTSVFKVDGALLLLVDVDEMLSTVDG